jgi:hypothetical protein
MNKYSKIFQRARELIATPDRWLQDATARNADGSVASSLDESAVCFCVGGAVERALLLEYGVQVGDEQVEVLGILDELCGGDVTLWNDRAGRTHAEALALLDRAAGSD